MLTSQNWTNFYYKKCYLIASYNFKEDSFSTSIIPSLIPPFHCWFWAGAHAGSESRTNLLFQHSVTSFMLKTCRSRCVFKKNQWELKAWFQQILAGWFNPKMFGTVLGCFTKYVVPVFEVSSSGLVRGFWFKIASWCHSGDAARLIICSPPACDILENSHFHLTRIKCWWQSFSFFEIVPEQQCSLRPLSLSLATCSLSDLSRTALFLHCLSLVLSRAQSGCPSCLASPEQTCLPSHLP